MNAWKALARAALHDCGGMAAVRRWNRSGLRILTYHSLPPELSPSLEWQCQHLRRYYQPVSLTEVAGGVGGKPLPPNALVVTIDDGYADISAAQAIFLKYGIKVTVYLVTDFLDHHLWFWWNRILYAFSQTNCRELEIELSPADPSLRFSIEAAPQRQHAADTLIEAVKSLRNSRRLAVCDELLDRLGVKLPAELPAEWRPLSWDQVRQLRREGVDFGAHTKTHPILPTIEADGLLHEEIVGSKHRIEQELGEGVVHFCYPNGQAEDLDRRTVETVRRAGFQTAVTTEPGVNFHGDPFLLRRFLVDPQQAPTYFAELVSGVHHVRARGKLRANQQQYS
jgi:peptidoglycan/xylan/chitin deacetylase (PgdA/CDA1 family)